MQDGRRTKAIIMGAAGRDLHNFNVVFRNDPLTRVVAFTAAQIPDIANRIYPAALCGPLYPNGIPVVDEAERVQRFGETDDLERFEATVEEREEHEPLLQMDIAVFAGVDYHTILHRAEHEADLIIWDGGNNDLPFVQPGLHIVLVDPHRPGDETSYHPGEANLRMADVIIINKADSATSEQLAEVQAAVESASRLNVPVILTDSILTVPEPDQIGVKRVLVVGDGPTLLHGGMSYGVGTIAARKNGAGEIISGRDFALGSIAEAYETYPHMDMEVPALGYSPDQLADLEATLNAADADLVLYATPVNLGQLVSASKPMVPVEYEMQERGDVLGQILDDFEYHRLAGG